MMVNLLTNKPAKGAPFGKQAIYPAFATFAGYYSAPSEDKRWLLLAKMRGGALLTDLVDVHDVAFLFFVYIAHCGHLGSVMRPRGWYFSDEATTTVKFVTAWMQEEQQDEKLQKLLPRTMVTFLAPLDAVLDSVVLGEDDDDDDDDDDELS